MDDDERERRAWIAYLEEVQRIPTHDLDALEPFHWRRLQARLRVIGRAPGPANHVTAARLIREYERIFAGDHQQEHTGT